MISKPEPALSRESTSRLRIARLTRLGCLLLAALAVGCERDDPFGEDNFYDNVYDAYASCRESEIKFLTGKHGIQTAFAVCGSNNFGPFSWSPDGIRLYFKVSHAGHILNGEEKTITTVPTPLPVTNGVWLDDDRLLALLPHQEADLPGQRVGVYDHRKATLQAVDTELREPESLQSGADAQHVYLTALDEAGLRRPYQLDLTTGEVERAFTWIEQPVSSFTYEPVLQRVGWSFEGSSWLAAADGSEQKAFADATRALAHHGGRWVVLERLGAALSNFDQTAWDELSEEARERAQRRRDAWAERLPEWTDTETRPPTMDLYDLDNDLRYRFTEFQGDEFEWYRARDHYLSFRMWGIEEKELNKNVALVDLTDRMRMLDRGTFPKGIELVQEVDAGAGGTSSPGSEPGPERPQG